MCSIVPEEGALSNITRKMFSGSKFSSPFLWLFFPRPGGVKWSSDIDAPVKTIVPPFPKTGNRARFTYLCENTIFFLPSSNAKRRYPKPFSQIPTSSCDASRRVVGWVNPYMCVEFELARAPST